MTEATPTIDKAQKPKFDPVEWLRSQQAVFDHGGASKDRRPEQTAAEIERLQKELGEARDFNNELHNALGNAVVSMRKRTIEECAQIAEQFAEVTGKLDGGMKSTAAAGMWNIAKAIRSIDGGGKP